MTQIDGAVHVWFLGVSTAQSAIHRLLPAWRDELQVNATVVGQDLPVGASAGAYMSFLDDLERDDRAIGAIVTVHKVGLLDAARMRFAAVEPVADLLGETNSVRCTGHGLEAYCRDGRALRRTLDETLDPGHWDTGAEVLCFGVGGAARALLLATMTESVSGRSPQTERPSRPKIFHAAGRSQDRLTAFAVVADAAGVPPECLRLHRMTSEADAAALVAELPASSLIVNATGLGKDAPGSPLPERATFPRGAIAWDFNYRGDLRFLDTAVAARVQAIDGWLYFLHGWTEALAPLLGRSLDDDGFTRLAAASEPFRPDGSRARVVQEALASGAPSPGRSGRRAPTVRQARA